MLQTIVGKKIDQTQAFLENGRRIPMSLISVSGNVVTQIKSPEKDKYSAVQVGFGDKRKTTKALSGHIKKAGISTTPRFFREVRVESTDGFELGKEINVAEVFEAGDVIHVTGTSKGKGYAGVVKRHHFRGGPRTHGQSDRERAPGSSGQTTTPGRVYKGKRMSGRMGTETVTIQNLIVLDIKDGVLYVKGLIPGIKGALVTISKAKDNKESKALKKNFVPLFKIAEEVVEEAPTDAPAEVENAGPVIETVEVEALPQEPEEIVSEQAEKVEEAVEEAMDEKSKEEVVVEEKKEEEAK